MFEARDGHSLRDGNVLSCKPGSPSQTERQHKAEDGRRWRERSVMDRQTHQLGRTKDPTNLAKGARSFPCDAAKVPCQVRRKEQLNPRGTANPTVDPAVTQLFFSSYLAWYLG